jgi:hypothetical protein
MGPEIAAAAPYLLAGGTALQMIGARQQQRERRGILNRAFDANEADTRRGTQDVVQEATQNAAPEARLRAMQGAEDATFGRTQADIAGAGGTLVDTAAGAGTMSPDFVRARADRALAEGDRMTAIARELAKVRAPGDVATNDSIRRSALSERLGSMWNTNRQRGNAAQMDAEAVQMPLYGELGQLGAMVGTAAALGGGGAMSPMDAYLTTGGVEGSIAGAGGGAAGAVGSARPWWMPMAQGAAASRMFGGSRR